MAFSRGTSSRSSASRALRRLSPRETPLPLLTETFSFLCWDIKPVHHSRRTSLNDHPSALRPLLRDAVPGGRVKTVVVPKPHPASMTEGTDIRTGRAQCFHLSRSLVFDTHYRR